MNLETNRLVLIPVCEEHIESIYIHFNENVVTYMLPAPAKSIDETRGIVSRFMDERRRGTDYVYAITRKANGEFIGLAGLHNLKEKVPELGIWTKLASHGNHYGREAIGALIDWARALGIKKLSYPVDRRNLPSKKIPLFYGGRLSVDYLEVKTADGRILEEEIYEIEL